MISFCSSFCPVKFIEWEVLHTIVQIYFHSIEKFSDLFDDDGKITEEDEETWDEFLEFKYNFENMSKLYLCQII